MLRLARCGGAALLVAAFFLYLPFSAAAAVRFPDAGRLAGFLGTFTGVATGIAL